MVNHALVEGYVRRYAESNMRDSVRVTRPGAPVLDIVAGSLTAGNAAIVYEGPGRIYGVGGPVDYQLGDEPQHFSSTYVSIPVRDSDDVTTFGTPQVEDVVEVLACPGDPEMVGRHFQVQDVEAAGQWTAVRRLQLVGIQDAPQNPPPVQVFRSATWPR